MNCFYVEINLVRGSLLSALKIKWFSDFSPLMV